LSRRTRSLVERLERTVRRDALLPPGTRVVAAVSGGSDSVALVRLLLALAPRLDLRVAGLAHVNHQLRGEASDADEAFCRQLARELGLPAHIERVTIERAGRSPEDAARRARYASLDRARAALDASRVALGHTRDDQAETVLLKLLRGAGARGAAAIHPQIDHYVRPLLGFCRAELRDWLAEAGYAWVEDATNADESIPRNRIRHVVLPALTSAIGADATGALARYADISRAEDALLDSLTLDVVGRVVTFDGATVSVSLAPFMNEPLAIQRRVLRHALNAAGLHQPSFDDVEALRELAAGEGTSVQVKGGRLANRFAVGGVLRIEREALRRPAAPFRYDLPVPGRADVPEAGLVVTAELASRIPVARGGPDDPESAVLDAATLAQGMAVRSWKAGDALRPLGVNGSKKLQDIFVDRKVPRDARHRLPLVADAADQVIWAPGLAIHDAVRVTADTKAVVVLKLTQVGGPE
jgi:tRNA(Ile)-lysidine synthase